MKVLTFMNEEDLNKSEQILDQIMRTWTLAEYLPKDNPVRILIDEQFVTLYDSYNEFSEYLARKKIEV